MHRIGVLTSGGDAPGMNAAIRAIVRRAWHHDIEVVGYEDGYSGLVEGAYRELDNRSVGNVIQRGGTILGTSRCAEFYRPDVRALAAQRMVADGIKGLVVIGGDGSFRGALELAEEHGVAVCGIPGTIDNDVWGTEETLGFDTAVNTAMQAIDALRDTSESTGTNFFVEVMGRTSGAIALYTGLAAGAAGVLIPETSEPPIELAKRLQRSIGRGKRSHIVVVSEGDEAGGAFGVAHQVAELMDIEFRVTVLGHTQRGGSPTARDRIIATESGVLAVDALVAGTYGMMAGMQHREPTLVPLADVVAHRHSEAELDKLRLAMELAG
ncbi:MAG: 6-phosphofructokinase [Dehalococcoidia bacterium]|nr:6-phosphofructokinase [Dehalococcoidia bacterium]